MICTNKLFNICLCTCLLLLSCKETPTNVDSTFETLPFKEELATITAFDDSTYIVGSQHGDIFFLCNGQEKSHLQSHESRIYQAFVDNEEGLWAGVRSSGVLKMSGHHSSEDNLPTGHWQAGRRMRIPQQGVHYSPYGLIPYRGDTILAATSHGLYYFSTHQTTDDLKPIAYKKEAGRPFVFCSPIEHGNMIYLASDDGIVCIKRTNAAPKIDHSLLNGHQIRKIEKDHAYNKLYALTDNCLFVINPSDHVVLKTLKLPFSAFSMTVALGNYYFLTQDWLYVTTDLDDIQNATAIKLPYSAPDDTRNLMIYDEYHQMIRLVTEHAILSLSALNGIGQNASMIHLSTYDAKSKTTYLLDPKNDLYALGAKDVIAQKLLHLPSTDNISAICTQDGKLIYVANHKQIKTVRLKSRWHNAFSDLSSSVLTTEKDITALYCLDDIMFVGVRDSLMAFKNGEPLRLVPPHIEPYVTHFQSNSSDTLYATTLNDGLWRINRKKDSLFADIIPNTTNIRFQTNVLSLDSEKTLLLNHHHLYLLKNGEPQATDSMEVSGFQRLLLLSQKDNLYRVVALSSHDVRLFDVTDDGLSSYPFHALHGQSIVPEGCIKANGHYYLSTEWGVMVADSLGNPAMYRPQFLSFDRSSYDINLTVVVILAVLAFLIIAFLGYRLYIINLRKLHEHKEHLLRLQEEEEQNVLQRKQAYMDRVQVLTTVVPYINDPQLSKTLEELRQEIKYSNIPDEDLNRRIQEMTMNSTLALTETLHTQIQQIKATNWKESLFIAMESEELLKNPRDVKDLLKCVKHNQQWLSQVENTEHILDHYEVFSTQVIDIPGVTEGLSNEIATIRNAFTIERLETAIKLFQALQLRMETIATAAKREKVSEYITQLTQQLPESPETQSLHSALTDFLEPLGELKDTNTEAFLKMLLDLTILCHRCQMQISLEGIRQNMSELASLTNTLKNSEKALQAMDETDLVKRRQLMASHERMQADIRTCQRQIRDDIKTFYTSARLGHADEALFASLQINLKAGEPSKRASLLAMLIACPSEKSSKIYESLGGNSYTYRSDMSHLIADIRQLRPQLYTLSTTDASSIANALLQVP